MGRFRCRRPGRRAQPASRRPPPAVPPQHPARAAAAPTPPPTEAGPAALGAGAPSTARGIDTGGDTTSMHQQAGWTQGYPLSPGIFAVATQRARQRTQDAMRPADPLARVLAFPTAAAAALAPPAVEEAPVLPGEAGAPQAPMDTDGTSPPGSPGRSTVRRVEAPPGVSADVATAAARPRRETPTEAPTPPTPGREWFAEAEGHAIRVYFVCAAATRTEGNVCGAAIRSDLWATQGGGRRGAVGSPKRGATTCGGIARCAACAIASGRAFSSNHPLRASTVIP